MTTTSAANGSYGRRFLTLFPESFLALAKDKAAPGDALRVLAWCFDALSHEQWRALRQVEVASVLGISHPSVSRSLAFLLERSVLERRGAGPRQEWRLAPEASWVGTTGGYHRARRERAEKKPALRVVGKPQVLAHADEPQP